MQKPWLGLMTVFGCHVFTGWLLASYQASLAVWLAIEIIIVYLSWIGAGAILLSIAGSIVIVGSGVMHSGFLNPFTGLVLSLNPAQTWAFALGVSLFWAILSIFKLASVRQDLRLSGFKLLQAFWLAFLTANLGLRLGQILEITTP